jgi:hypothetical protein
MNPTRDKVVIAAAGLVGGAALLLAWVAGVAIRTGSGVVNGALAMSWLMLMGCAVLMMLRRMAVGMQQAWRSLDRLADAEEDGEPSAASAPDGAPAGPSPWGEAIGRVRQALLSARRQAREAAERAADLEDQVRRATAQCERITRIVRDLPEPVLAVNEQGELVLVDASGECLFDYRQGAFRLARQPAPPPKRKRWLSGRLPLTRKGRRAREHDAKHPSQKHEIRSTKS